MLKKESWVLTYAKNKWKLVVFKFRHVKANPTGRGNYCWNYFQESEKLVGSLSEREFLDGRREKPLKKN